MSDPKSQIAVQAASSDPDPVDSPSKNDPTLTVTSTSAQDESSENETPADQIDGKKKSFWAYFQTKEFYITLLLG